MRILILGITGQDGSILAELCLARGDEVHGFIRRSATGNTKNIDHIKDKLILHYGDLTDHVSLELAIKKSNPDVIFNEADQDSAAKSFEMPIYNYQVTGLAVGVLLEIIRNFNPEIKFFQPISSNALDPKTPFAVGKKFAWDLCEFYRAHFGLKVYSAIPYNHVSPRQPEDYLMSKVIRSVKRIKEGKQDKLELGDMKIKLDIGWAEEFMERFLETLDKEPGDYYFGTGELYSVEDLVRMAFEQADLDYRKYIEVNPKFLRPTRNIDLKSPEANCKIHGEKLIELLYDNTSC